MSNDILRGHDAFRVGAGVPLGEGIRHDTLWVVRRWDEDATKWAQRRMEELGGARFVGVQPQERHFDLLGVKPYSETEVVGNLLTTIGIAKIVSLATVIGTPGATISSTTARVGVGDGVGSAAASDTDLSTSTKTSAHQWFNLCTVTAPSNVMTFASTFATGDGNFAWNEFGIDVAAATVTAGATVQTAASGNGLINHKTGIAQGTKASGQTWSATATITLS